MDKVRKKKIRVKQKAFTIHENVQPYTEMGDVHGSTCLILTIVKLYKKSKLYYLLSLKNHAYTYMCAYIIIEE